MDKRRPHSQYGCCDDCCFSKTVAARDRAHSKHSNTKVREPHFQLKWVACLPSNRFRNDIGQEDMANETGNAIPGHSDCKQQNQNRFESAFG
jgi:hypothetical protein